jgi:hypothetical protein
MGVNWCRDVAQAFESVNGNGPVGAGIDLVADLPRFEATRA